jgi:hypothetical protein
LWTLRDIHDNNFTGKFGNIVSISILTVTQGNALLSRELLGGPRDPPWVLTSNLLTAGPYTILYFGGLSVLME